MSEQTSPWSGQNVFVTGCTGFLGSAVVRELLAAGAGVVGLVRDRAAAAAFARRTPAGRAWAVHGRAEDVFRLHSALAVYEVGAVFHLTAATPNQPDRGAAAVVEAARRYDPRVPVVLARPVVETPPPGPLLRGKGGGKTEGPGSGLPPPPFRGAGAGGRGPDFLRSPRPASGGGLGGGIPAPPIPLGIARFGELFGPGDRKAFRVVPATVLGLLAGDGGLPSAGDTPRDFVHVGDAARACLRLAEHLLERPGPRREDYAFRSGWVFTDRTMAAAVREASAGRPVPPTGPTPPNPFGWSPAASFADALAETITWYRESAGNQLAGPTPADAPRRAA
jgi:CDP-glucose 4,6-dehydratase